MYDVKLTAIRFIQVYWCVSARCRPADFNTDPVRIADISVSPVDVIYATSQPSRVLITSVVTTAMASDAPCFVTLRRIHACSVLRLKYGGIFLAVYKKFVA